MSKAEKETIIRWDCEDRTPKLYTADPAQARRWSKLGYQVAVLDTDRKGTPRSWVADGALGCVRFRRLEDGAIVKRTNGGENLSMYRQVRERPPAAPPHALPIEFDAGICATDAERAVS